MSRRWFGSRLLFERRRGIGRRMKMALHLYPSVSWPHGRWRYPLYRSQLQRRHWPRSTTGLLRLPWERPKELR